MPARQNITIFLIDSKSMFRIMPVLEYLKDALTSIVNYGSIIKYMLAYMKSTGEYSYLEAFTDSMLHDFYGANIDKDGLKQERKDILTRLYILRHIEYRRMIPIGRSQRVVIFVPNREGNSCKDVRISFDLHYHGILPLDLYWICYDMAANMGVNLIYCLCTIHGADNVYLKETIIIHRCEVIELKYVPSDTATIRSHLELLRNVCTWSTRHRNRVTTIDGYIKHLYTVH
jgi:hypothetical protein